MLGRVILRQLNFLAIIIAVNCVTGFNVTLSQSIIKQSVILGSSMKLGYFEVYFDEPVYFYHGLGSCANRTCQNPPTSACPPCDYTDPSVCMGLYVNASCPCPVLPNTCAIQTSFMFGQPYTTFLEVSAFGLYLVYINDSILWNSNGCNNLFFNLSVIWGEPDLYINNAENFEETGTLPLLDENFGGGECLLCASSSYWRPGTYVIGINSYDDTTAATGDGTKFILDVTNPRMPDPRDPPPPCTVPPQFQSTHKCLQDRVPYYWTDVDIGDYSLFVFEIPPECPVNIYYEAPPGALILTGMDKPVIPLYSDYTHTFTATPNWEATKGVVSACGPNNQYFFISYQNTGDDYLLVDTSKDWVELLPTTHYTPFDYGFSSLSTSIVRCGTPEDFVCNRRATGGPTLTEDCFRYWQAWPAPSSNPFFPRPPFAFGSASWQQIALVEPLDPLIPNKYAFVALMDLTLDSTLITSDATISYLNDEQFQNCTMTFTGKIANFLGEPFLGTINFSPKPFTCQYTDYTLLADNLSTFLQNMTTLVDFTMIRNLRYEADMLSFDDAWLGCINLANQVSGDTYINETVYTDKCITPPNTIQFQNDPCCNQTLQWTTPCLSRPQEIPYKVFTLSNDGQCPNDICIPAVLNEFVSVQNTVNDETNGCDSVVEDSETFSNSLWEPYKICRDQSFGINQTIGIPCDHDDDCTNGTICAKPDKITGRCVYRYDDDQINQFIQCLLDNLDSFLVVTIQNTFTSFDSNNPVLSWRLAFTGPTCIDNYTHSLAVEGRSYWIYESAISPNCIDYWCNDLICIDNMCTLSFQCDAGQNCWKTWASSPSDAANCEGIISCNWMDCTGDPNCQNLCLNSSTAKDPVNFCGLCENGFNCYEVYASSKQVCEDRILCRLNNGTEIFVNSEEECNNIMSCSQPCYYGACATEGDCLNAGSCSDAFLYQLNGPSVGLCITGPLLPYTFLNGCIGKSLLKDNYINYVVSTPLGCADPNITITNCTNPNNHWIYAATNESECLGFGNVCQEPFSSADLTNSYIFTYKNQTNCEIVGGTFKQMFTWTQGTWRSGQIRRLTWGPRQYLQQYQWDSGFDFNLLGNAISDVIEKKYTFQLQSTSQCKYNQQLSLLSSISCSCSFVKNESCFGSFAFEAVAISQVCGGSPVTLKAPPSTLQFDRNTLPIGNCTTVSVDIVSAFNFRYSSNEVLSSFFLQVTEEVEWRFRNSKNALIGQILSSGVTLEFEEMLSSVYICVTPATEIPQLGYPVLDFGIQFPGDNAIIPLGVPVYLDLVLGYCANISNPQSRALYIPIQIAEQWEDQRQTLFNINEKAFMGIVLVIYVCNLVFAIYKCSYNVTGGLNLNLALFILLAIFSLDRFILFLLALMDINFDTQLPTGLEYIIVELPSYLFFTATSLIVLAWFYVLRRVKRLGMTQMTVRKLFNRFALIINCCIYVVLIVVIVLFETIPEPPGPPCGNLVVFNSQVNKGIIVLVYRIFVSALSATLGSFFLIYGSRVYLILQKGGGQGDNKRGQRRIIFLSTTICSLALIVQSLYLLVLAIINTSNTYVSLFLLLISEALPIFAILFTLKGRVESGASSSSVANSIERRRATNPTEIGTNSTGTPEFGTNSTGTHAAE